MWGLVVGTGILGALYLVLEVYPNRRWLQRFSTRKELSDSEIIDSLALELPEYIALNLWSEVADCLSIPKGKLRPTDRFRVELAPLKGWEFDGPTASLTLAAMRRMGRLGIDIDLESLLTVQDYVRVFGQHERTLDNP